MTHLIFDVVERALWTFVQAFAGVMTGTNIFNWDVPVWQQAVASGVAAVFATLKGFAASRLGVLGTAATLPAAVSATGTVAGEVTGTVVDTAGEVVGEVTGIVGGVVDEITGQLDKED